ncbi:MAG: hypothetical protein JKY96_04785 [Phycisphaerales bacterium]|nr:hypothetical protein [Phycisphaerales bacterium]
MNLVIIPYEAHELPSVWPYAVEHLQAFCDRSNGHCSIGHIHLEIASDRAKLWLGFKGEYCVAAATTIIELRENQKVLTVQHCGAKGMDGWKEHLEVFTNHAKNNQCSSIEFEGRPGWQRVLPQVSVVSTTYRMEVI